MSKRTQLAGLALVLALVGGLPGVAHGEDETGPTKEVANKAPLWVIEGDTPTYLFGTMHVPDPKILKLPPLVDAAIEASEGFIGEMPLDMASQMKVQTKMMLAKGETLDQIAGSELYGRIKALLPSFMPEMLVRQFNPWAVISMLEAREYAQATLQGRQPLDMALHTRFVRAKKKIDALEAVDDQVRVLNSFAREEQLILLKATVEKVEKEEKSGKSSMATMLETYMSGDLKAIMELVTQGMSGSPELDAKLKKAVLDDRNASLTATLVKKLKADPETSYFVAVGIGHFPGKGGMLERLEKAGYSVRRLAAGDPLPKKKKEAATAAK